MTKSSSSASSGIVQPTKKSQVLARVEKFPQAEPKIKKDSWESGEGAPG